MAKNRQRDEFGAAAETTEQVTEFVEEHYPIPPVAPPSPRAQTPAVYLVHLDGCPRRKVPTGMPACPQAEEVAKVSYLVGLGITPRAGINPTVTLTE